MQFKARCLLPCSSVLPTITKRSRRNCVAASMKFWPSTSAGLNRNRPCRSHPGYYFASTFPRAHWNLYAVWARARADDWPLPPLRIGVHIASGVPKAGASDSSRTDSSVDGAIRVARWATPNQAVATPAFHSNAMELLKKGAQHFKNLGRVTAKDGKSLAVFEIIPFSNHNKPRTGKRS